MLQCSTYTGRYTFINAQELKGEICNW